MRSEFNLKENFQIVHGDCFEVLKTFPDNSIDSVVTDPPYGIRFMGESWDGEDIEQKVAKRRSQAFNDKTCSKNGGHNSIAAEAGKYDFSLNGMKAFEEWTCLWATEILRILKPGGHLISFAAPRSYHRMVSGIEDAGFEIRDQIQWIFGSGFPKSHNLSGKFKGWGTGLKPGYEPICLARKPIKKSVANNMADFGVGAINIDGCRINTDKNVLGRWPANLIHDGSRDVLSCFPEAKGQQGNLKKQNHRHFSPNGIYGVMSPRAEHIARIEDDRSAARFFYCAKASRKDRNDGTENLSKKNGGMISNTSGMHITRRDISYAPQPQANFHPTVKPTELMRYVCRLVTPKGGTVLDPFTGSGSTGKAAILEGLRFFGIEREDKYIPIANARCLHALNTLADKKPSRIILELI